MKTNFLTDDIWKTIKTLSDTSRKTKVAVAYFGTGASKLINLKKGDVLLVSMTIGNVKAGQVNPSEIEIIFKKGVQIYTLINLHAKIFLFDKSVIVGSTNASFNSADTLIEAAILTDDKKAIKDAEEFFLENCVEKVESDYIKLCKSKYNPPKFLGAKSKRTTHKFKGRLSPLWVLSTTQMKNDYHPEDVKIYDKKLPTFENKLKDKKKFEVNKIYYPINHRVISEIKTGDIIVQIHCHKVKTNVCEPCRVLGIIKNSKTQKAQLLYEGKIDSITKQWKPLENILRKNQIKGIKRVSSRRIENENTKKILLNYFK